MTTVEHLHPSDPAYWRALRKPAKAQSVELEPYPAPEHTSRDPWPEGIEVPGPVAKLRALAESHGWAVGVTYSRNHTPRVDNGKPGASAHHIVLRMLHPESRARCVAHYTVLVESPAGKKWLSVLITSATIPPYIGCSITDAQEYVRAAGRVLPGWLEAVKWRNTLSAIRDKVWRDYCAGHTLAAMAGTYEVDKAIVTKIVQDCRAASKVKPGTARGRKQEAGG